MLKYVNVADINSLELMAAGVAPNLAETARTCVVTCVVSGQRRNAASRALRACETAPAIGAGSKIAAVKP